MLRYSAWERIYHSPSAWKRYWGVIRHNFRLSKDVGSYLAQSEPFDVVLAPTMLAHHVLGWRRLTRKFALRKFSRLVMIFVNTRPESGGRAISVPHERGIHADGAAALGQRPGPGAVTLATETRRAGEQFQAFCGAKFTLLPHVVNLAPGGSGGYRNGVRPVFGSFGFARHEKGSDLLQQAAAPNIWKTAIGIRPDSSSNGAGISRTNSAGQSGRRPN